MTKFFNAASVVELSLVAAEMSNSGGGGGPRLFRSVLDDVELTEVEESFCRFTLSMAPVARSLDGRGERLIDGNTNFFC